MLWALEQAPVDDQGALLVLIALAERADENGQAAYPAKAWLAKRARCSERTVQRHLGVLRLGGLIREGDQRHVEHLRQDRRPVVYDLRLPMVRGDSLTPPTMLHGESPEVATGSQDGYPRGDTGVSQTVPTEVTTQEPLSVGAERADVERLCQHLADRIEANGSKRPTITKGWRDAARLLMDNDGRTEDQVHRAIDWCQDDEFWRSNVLSMPKLRQQYDRLRLRAAQDKRATSARNDHADHWANGGQFAPAQ